jgi:Mg2+/Co2+ transporter CorC
LNKTPNMKTNLPKELTDYIKQEKAFQKQMISLYKGHKKQETERCRVTKEFSVANKMIKKQEDEIKLLIDKGTQAGVFQEFEQDTIERVFRLADRRVSVLMTHRADIIWLNLNENVEESKHKIADTSNEFHRKRS